MRSRLWKSSILVHITIPTKTATMINTWAEGYRRCLVAWRSLSRVSEDDIHEGKAGTRGPRCPVSDPDKALKISNLYESSDWLRFRPKNRWRQSDIRRERLGSVSRTWTFVIEEGGLLMVSFRAPKPHIALKRWRERFLRNIWWIFGERLMRNNVRG